MPIVDIIVNLFRTQRMCFRPLVMQINANKCHMGNFCLQVAVRFAFSCRTIALDSVSRSFLHVADLFVEVIS